MAKDEKNTEGTDEHKGATPQSTPAADVDRQEQSATTVSNENTDSPRSAKHGESESTDQA